MNNLIINKKTKKNNFLHKNQPRRKKYGSSIWFCMLYNQKTRQSKKFHTQKEMLAFLNLPVYAHLNLMKSKREGRKIRKSTLQKWQGWTPITINEVIPNMGWRKQKVGKSKRYQARQKAKLLKQQQAN